MFTRVAAAAVVACVIVGAAAVAQEGHPLTGTWSGDWGPTPAQRTRITLVMAWDGKSVTGTLNPGPNAVELRNIFLDVSNWTVRIEAETKDASGKPTKLAAEGQLDDIGSYRRRLAGTWTQAGAKGDFRLTRE